MPRSKDWPITREQSGDSRGALNARGRFDVFAPETARARIERRLLEIPQTRSEDYSEV